MGSFRSFFGSFLSLIVFFTARRFCNGFALPLFLFLIFACAYAWAFVLRIPELHKPLQSAREPPPPEQQAAEAPRTPTAPKAAPVAPKAAPKVPRRETAPKAEEAAEEAAAEAAAEAPPVAAAEKEEAEEPAPKPAAAAAEEAAEAAADAPQAPAPLQATAPAAAPAPVPPAEEGAEVAAEERPEEGPALGPAADRRAAGSAGEEGGAEEGRGQEAAAKEDEGGSSAGEEPEENDLADLPRAQELRLEGNEHFKAGKLHDAREAYSEAIHLMPLSEKKERAVLHSNRAACLQKLSRWDEVISDCKKAVDLDPEYAKAYRRRSVAYEAQNKWHDAFEDLKKAVELDPSLRSAEARRLHVLEKRAQEQFEKDKDEMLGKLKDLGNTVLGKFGMSMDNFKMEQDPGTGSYSIKFNS